MPPWEGRNSDPEFLRVQDVVRLYVERFHLLKPEGIGLMLIGPYGCGKTWLLKQIETSMKMWMDGEPNEYGARPRNPYYHKVELIQAGTMLAWLKEAFDWKSDERDSFHAALIESELLMIDDLGTEYQTDWAMNEMGRFIDERYSRNNPIIISINKLESLSAHQTRIVDRISETCIPIDMSKCPNIRHDLRKEKRNRFEEITGVSA